MKKLKCCGCKSFFDKDTLLPINGSNFHSIGCATTYARAKSDKLKKKEQTKQDKDHRQKKRELRDNDRSIQLKKTQELFNRFIRARDRNDPCVSCGRHHPGQYHAGHYRSVGANPELRFNERNCHKQCSACNNYLSGNIVNYRMRLLKLLGAKGVADLEGPHEPKRYTIEELKDLQKHYKQLIKEIESDER